MHINEALNCLNCVNLARSMESGVGISIPSLGFTGKNDINKHVWYSISSLVFNPNVGFECKKDSKDQESIQSSTTPAQGYQMRK